MGHSRVIGFTPYAKENLLTGHGRIRGSQKDVVAPFVMSGWEGSRRVKRVVTVTLYVAWIDYCDHEAFTHLWTVRNGRRRLVHRKR